MSPQSSLPALDRLREICLALPDTHETVSHGAPTFWHRKRTFAMFASADTHHGGGRPAVWCKSTHFLQEMLIQQNPARIFSPPYAGPSGWIGIWLDRRVSWRMVKDLLRDAHTLAVPKKPTRRR